MTFDLQTELKIMSNSLVKCHNSIKKEKKKLYTFTCDTTYRLKEYEFIVTYHNDIPYYERIA